MARALQRLLARAANLASVDLPRFLAVLGGAGACAGLFLAGVYGWGTLHQSPDGRVAVVTPHRTSEPKPPTASPTPASPVPEPTSVPPSGPTPLRSPAPVGSVLAAQTGGNGAPAAPITTQEPQPARRPSIPTPPAPTPSPAAPAPAFAPATSPPAPQTTPVVSVGVDLGDILDLQLSL